MITGVTQSGTNYAILCDPNRLVTYENIEDQNIRDGQFADVGDDGMWNRMCAAQQGYADRIMRREIMLNRLTDAECWDWLRKRNLKALQEQNPRPDGCSGNDWTYAQAFVAGQARQK